MDSFTKSEFERFLAKVKEINSYHWLMFVIGYSHGLRVSELTSLTKDNVIGDYLIVQRKKNSNKTKQPLTTLEKQELLDLLLIKKNETLFPYTRSWVRKLMRKYGELAGVPLHKCHPHTLKHTTAKLGLDSGMKINEVQAYLGHKSGGSTLEYLKVNDEEASQSFAKVDLR
jgi:integrase/recombinase XerC